MKTRVLKIVEDYDSGLSYSDLIMKYKVSTKTLHKLKKLGILKPRSISESLVLSHKRKPRKLKNVKCLQDYREKCRFLFDVYAYPDKFNLTLLETHGWYSPKNRKNNLSGISRDHMYSISDGFKNKIDPSMLAHPANCSLKIHNENVSKGMKSEITIDELIKRIDEWNNGRHY